MARETMEEYGKVGRIVSEADEDGNYYYKDAMGGSANKFLLLMWKNWKLQYRKPVQTLIEIIVPVVFTILLVITRKLVDPELQAEKVYDPYCSIPQYTERINNFFNISLCPSDAVDPDKNLSGILSMRLLSKMAKKSQDKPLNFLSMVPGNITSVSELASIPNVSIPYQLIYSPNTNDDINRIMDYFTIPFGGLSAPMGFEDSVSLENYYLTSPSESVLAAIQFDDKYKDMTTIENEKDLKVNIRFPSELKVQITSLIKNWKTNLVFPLFQYPGPRLREYTSGAEPNYYKEGFLAIQHFLGFAITLAKNNVSFQEAGNWLIDNPFPKVMMRRFAYAEFYSDELLEALISMFPLIVMMSFVYTAINTVKAITTEKEKQLKESMKIMGLPNWLHWTAWFIKCLIFLFVSILIMVLLLKVKWYPNSNHSVLTYSDSSVLLFFLLVYISCSITFCFAVSVFFSKANNASTIAGLIWFFAYVPYVFVQQSYDDLTLVAKLFISLTHNSAMAFGFQVILMYEGTGEGMQWNNLFEPITSDDNLSLGLVIIMLLVDTLMYLLIALYVEAVFPGEYGVPKPWYYLFTKSYWCGEDETYEAKGEAPAPPRKQEFFEPDPKNLKIGIKIANLRKEFGDKIAVNNLTVNMYQDQITVLLGHNGAGKTTTMSMLTGMITPSAGTASINGYDIRRNIEGVRHSLGLCPQHNIIFDELTVAEHFYFYGKLKGMPSAEIDAEVDKYVELLAFEAKRNSKSSTLSGGMKRKLCVGIALCGGSKVVMLDEPTSGMDPSARRVLWSLIQSQKEGRTILLSTHFMDEADLLGDRIAIMAEGELQCCGSSFFLKKKYGTGYSLIMDKGKDCDVLKTTQLLKKYIPDIEVHGNVGSELSYLLEENRSAVFEAMLKDLENNSDQLGIRSYGISLTTMEEVFMKVGADHEKETTNGSLHNNKISMGNGSLAPTHTGGFNLIVNQFYAMLIKKYLSIIRSWFLFVCQLLIPALLLVIAVMTTRTQQKLGPLTAREMSLSQFSSPITLVQAVDDSTVKNYKDAYEKILDDRHFATEEQSNLTDVMISLTKTVPNTVRRNYIVGASFEYSNEAQSPLLTAYFNNDPYHSPGVALGLVLNAIYKIQTNCDDCSINFVNYPLPYTAESQVEQVSALPNMGFNLSFNIGFSMAFVSAFYVLFVVRENVSKSKHLQFVSGMKAWIFWITSFLVDISTYFGTVILYIIVLLILNENGFTTAGDIGRILVIMLYFAWAFLPLVYLLGYLFQIPSTGFTRVMLTAIFSGNAAFMIVQIFQQINENLKDVGKTLHWIFLLSPYYSLTTGFSESYSAYSYNSFCKKYYDICNTTGTCTNITASVAEICKVADGNYYKWDSPGIGRNIVYSFIEGIVFFLIIFTIEYEVFARIIYFVNQKLFPKYPVEVPNEDSDVREEREKIRNNHEADLHNSYILALKDLTKYYKDFLAVNGLCLGVKKFECFGLLGINGAGKTTTFKMMTGDEKISYGEGWVNGHSMKTDLKEVQKAIGYCPQFDALLDDMTGRETIVMYALIRGISFQDSRRIPEYLAREFDFSKHLDKRVKQMSGGNKRKLSTSLSLIGDPPLLYLDEPTTGMDPATKRYLWDVLCRIRDSGKSIVLTSHSMEECEALCTRLAIMVNGNFKCLGSTQHLKSKFAEGYSLAIKIRKRPGSSGHEHSETGHIEEFIRQQLPRAELKEKHEELLNYHIRDKSIPWSRMFGILEEGKRQHEDIEDYSLGQSTLEQVFLTFTGGVLD